MTAISLACDDPTLAPPSEYLSITSWLSSLPPLSVVKVTIDSRITDCWVEDVIAGLALVPSLRAAFDAVMG